MKRNLQSKHFCALLVILICIGCISSLNSCTSSAHHYHYKLTESEENSSPYFQSIVSIPYSIEKQITFLHAAIVEEKETLQILLFQTDSSGQVLQSRMFLPPQNIVLNQDILGWFQSQHSTYLFFGSTSIDKDPNYNIHFLPFQTQIFDEILPDADIVSFSSPSITMQNYCSIANHFFLAGSYTSSSQNNSYGLIVEFVEITPGKIEISNTSLLHIPTNTKGQYSTNGICSIIPNASSKEEKYSVHFSTQNSYVGTYYSGEDVKNCYSIPGFYPSLQNKMYTHGETIIVENHPQSSYDADLIQVLFNGKTSHIHIFNQYPNLTYNWIGKKSMYDASQGMIALGFSPNQNLFLVGDLNTSLSSIQGWQPQNNYQMAPNPSIYTDSSYIYMTGLFSHLEGEVSESNMLQSTTPYIEFLQNPWKVSKWHPALQKMKRNEIPDPEKTHIYYNDQQNNTLDLKKVQREVTFVKPFPVSDMTGEIFKQEKILFTSQDFPRISPMQSLP